MILALPFAAMPVPLKADAHGVVRVGGTRVTLDTVVAAFRNGATAEQIAQDFDAVSLSDIYATITYYLHHQKEVDQYLADRERQTQEVILQNPSLYDQQGLRERLLARRAKQGP
ncbi:MAG TPA: DUF433 domain-containing protein [Tepidisphaeraceae bacterium]|jgi:uncharacterized protein (DUF433 family)|nr:DUF433 domain-containing protein [Tepidisphaeraceae bacterium]